MYAPAGTVRSFPASSRAVRSSTAAHDDLLVKYLENEPIDLVFDIETAKGNAARTVTFD